MSIFTDLYTELREKRLWPVAAVLVLALIAVPLLLSKSSSAPSAPAPAPALSAGAPASGVPKVEVASVPVHHKLTGHARNPFHQPGVHKLGSSSSVPGGTATTGAAPSTSTAGAATHAGGASTGSGAAHASAPSAPAVAPTPATIPVRKTIRPAPTGLTPRQSYDVKLAITLASGGLQTIDSLERLSALPSRQLPLLVELGVLKGARRVLFAVEPGATVTGPGKCLPGPIDCEILSMPENKIETLSSPRIPSAAQFAVTGISAARHRSRADAQRARARSSAFGARLVRQAGISILSLFPYDMRTGTIRDLRSLSVGGK
jgi:hypothetical protein